MERMNLSIEYGETYPIYVLGEAPFWFVPGKSAHELLHLWLEGHDNEELADIWSRKTGQSRIPSELELLKLFSSIKPPPYSAYHGKNTLALERLSEVWFHVTEICNLSCRHCLFGGTQNHGRSLNPQTIIAVLEEAYTLGSRLFCFTGGEPFMYPAYLDCIEKALTYEDASVVTLTNGILLQKEIHKLKDLDAHRMHFQVSIDGTGDTHDSLRGKGTFSRSVDSLRLLVNSGIPCSIAMAVNEQNVHEMASVVKLACRTGVETIHFLWHFKRGNGEVMEIVPMDTLIPHFNEAIEMSRETGVLIDNMEALRAQVFTPAGTRFDFGNGGWESLAVSPDGSVYPTPAMVGMENCCAGNILDGIEWVWRESPLLKKVRGMSLTDIPEMKDDPWRFIIGGGDIDHCVINRDNGKNEIKLVADPYVPLYKYMAKMIIEEEARALVEPARPGLILRMGDIVHECPTGADVNFTHCNCLLSLGEEGMQGLVRQFYGERAKATDTTIINPVRPDKATAAMIPEEAFLRSYGCGSPVEDANIMPGETVVDLGSGTGVECLTASRKVGKNGSVIGIDMTDNMLHVAREAKREAEQSLGFSNTSFIKGFLEAIPMKDHTVDVVISNCVINLTGNKRRVFREIGRILKPGGRLVISDVVSETEPSLTIRADHRLTGECIGGAMVQDYLFAVLEDMGFTDIKIIKRFPYRVVQGHPFYSLTFSAASPGGVENTLPLMYAGPFRAVVTEDGKIIRRGTRESVAVGTTMDTDRLGEGGFFVVDEESGAFLNLDAESSCACFVPSEATDADLIPPEVPETGCLVCGAPLVYLNIPEKRTCAICGKTLEANAICGNGHFVCDLCHIQEPLEVIKQVCLTSSAQDMIRLLQMIRAHKKIPMHGPEHHALVPGIILAAYRNLGGEITEKELLTGIQRGNQIPGGSCGFMGICGAAVGVGIAFSLILNSNPLTPKERQIIQRLVSQIIGKISERKAARCCQRECYIALKEAARLSFEILPISLKADFPLVCEQHTLNRECIRSRCLIYPEDSQQILEREKKLELVF